jgi:hypothetical protein
VHDSSHGLNVTLPFSKSGMMSWLLLFRVFIVHYGLIDTLLGTPCKYSFWGETITTKTGQRWQPRWEVTWTKDCGWWH